MLDIRPISLELTAKARVELHEVESRIPEDVAALRGWILMQPHLKSRTDDQFLVTFLRGAKYSLEKAKQKLDYYYTIRSLSPDFFLDNAIDDKIIKLAKSGTFVTLPKPLGVDGPRIRFMHFHALDPGVFKFEDILKFQVRILDTELHEDDNATIGGTITIVDMSKLSLRLFMHFEPSSVKKMLVFTEKGLPMRYKGLHLLNMPREIVAIVNFARSIMSKKISGRTMIHSSLDSLYEHIPQEYLPEEYGGNNGRIQDAADTWAQRLIERKQFFEDEKQYGVDESRRIGTHITQQTLFGIDGSFRKLQID